MANTTNPLEIVCTLDTCPIENSFFDYRPSLAANTSLLALFGLSLLANLVQGVAWKTWTFMIAMVLGNLTEILGYVGRVMAYNDPFKMDPFLMQICCLTLAPAFFAAGIYLCLSRIVIIFGADISRIPPAWYTKIFISCDFISLILQATGGGIASVTSQNGEDPKTGNDIMVAGLAFQVFTLALFMCLCAEYTWRVVRSGRQLDAMYAQLRGSLKFKGFLGSLVLSTVCIMIRSVYRLIEMSQGWEGELIRNETYFFVLEGIMVVLAVLVLNVFHPGMCMRDAYHQKVSGRSRSDTKRRPQRRW
ncbi:RTA1 like protein-domain-containing protein [Geopyxis carbonaria]|nr:RTA1 like protein-domain-containing protein [Geopyxis carbonaria]